jgi:hypothetical protein
MPHRSFASSRVSSVSNPIERERLGLRLMHESTKVAYRWNLRAVVIDVDEREEKIAVDSREFPLCNSDGCNSDRTR